MRYALVNKKGKVINVIEYDGKSKYDPGKDLKLVKGEKASMGDTYSKGKFKSSEKKKIKKSKKEV